MLPTDIQTVEKVWPSVATVLVVPHNDQEYQQLVDLLDTLIDEVGEDETRPLASLMEVIGALTERYEAEHMPELSGIE